MNNDYGFAEKHEAVLCLLDEIDRLCRENGIKYSLHGGTLLGAEPVSYTHLTLPTIA